MALLTKGAPGNLLNHTPLVQLKKSCMFVADPETIVSVLGDGSHNSAGKAAHGNETVALQVANCAKRSDPDSTAMFLKERIWDLPISRAVPDTGGSDFPVIPFVQAAFSAKPEA